MNVRVKASEGFKLSAPNKGKMERCVYESVSAVIEIILNKNSEVIFSGSSTNCGLEIV